jgi:hypothetical protein
MLTPRVTELVRQGHTVTRRLAPRAVLPAPPAAATASSGGRA